MGTQSTTVSPSLTRSRSMGPSSKASGAVLTISERSSSMPFFSSALIGTTFSPKAFSKAAIRSEGFAAVSILLTARMYFVPSFLNSEIKERSKSETSLATSITMTATSVLVITSLVLPILSLPKSPISSMPAVSMIITGPRGSISIALNTGSVVVPATSLTSAMFCLVSALITLDLPAFLLPKIPMWTRIPLGV